MRFLPCGATAFLVELDDLDAVLSLDAAVRELGDEAIVDVIPAARTLLVTVTDPAQLGRVRERVAAASSAPVAGGRPPAEVVLDVAYDGPDLAEVARLTGLTPDEVVAAHTGTDWRVAFGGFAPGFAYLTGGDPRLRVPRRPEPRTRVPAGSVALAGPYSAVYPRSSPGGWQLIGRTATPLFDLDRDPPALLRAGMSVRFRTIPALDVDQNSETRSAAPPAPRRALESCARAVEVLAPGPSALLQDTGRPGWAHAGVTRSGAADAGALALANRLVGNPSSLAAIEATFGGLRVRVTDSVCVAVTGAHAPATVNGRPVPHAVPLYLTAGDELALGIPDRGLRSYVAFSGGCDVPAVLGSRASDTLSGLGPAPLAAGDLLPIGPQPAVHTLGGEAPPPAGHLDLDYLPGPRADWLADPDALAATAWVVSARADRVGVGLDGIPLRRADAVADAELPSEGTVRGAIQVPGGGLPVIFGPDHPVTGGYPVVGVLTPASCDRLAQARPGDPVRLHPAPSPEWRG